MCESDFVILFFQIILDNGPARSNAVSLLMVAAGDEVGDMFEVSTIRREVSLYLL